MYHEEENEPASWGVFHYQMENFKVWPIDIPPPNRGIIIVEHVRYTEAAESNKVSP